jgi:Spy/CpxP family protein refolding chaperone
MSMKTVATRALAVVLTVGMMLAAGNSYAQEGQRGSETNSTAEAREGRFKKMPEELQLTPQQKAELEKQREAFAAKIRDLKEKIQTARSGLKEELNKASPDKARLDDLVTQIKNLVGEHIQGKVDRVMAMKQVLTPEQYSKMKALKADRATEKSGHRGDRGAKGLSRGDM